MPSPSGKCDEMIPRFGCGWIHRKRKVRESCTLLLEERRCPLLKHRLDEEWDHVPGYVKAKVLSGTYPAERLERWERIVHDLLGFLLEKTDPNWGDTYTTFHAAVGILREEVHEFETEVFAMKEPRRRRAVPEDVKAAIGELRDVAAVALMAQFHLTDYYVEKEDPR